MREKKQSLVSLGASRLPHLVESEFFDLKDKLLVEILSVLIKSFEKLP